jgi:hypothetical protein
MQHDLFGEITYDADDQLWHGRCSLPSFAQYDTDLADDDDELPEEEFRRGLFPLQIQDETGRGPSSEQEQAFRYLQENEPEVCRAVMSEVLASATAFMGKPGCAWGWARRLAQGPQTLEDLRTALRCTGVEVSALHLGGYAYLGVEFLAYWEIEHGLAVVYHPQKGTFWSDATALSSIDEADNLDVG